MKLSRNKISRLIKKKKHSRSKIHKKRDGQTVVFSKSKGNDKPITRKKGGGKGYHAPHHPHACKRRSMKRIYRGGDAAAPAPTVKGQPEPEPGSKVPVVEKEGKGKKDKGKKDKEVSEKIMTDEEDKFFNDYETLADRYINNNINNEDEWKTSVIDLIVSTLKEMDIKKAPQKEESKLTWNLYLFSVLIVIINRSKNPTEYPYESYPKLIEGMLLRINNILLRNKDTTDYNTYFANSFSVLSDEYINGSFTETDSIYWRMTMIKLLDQTTEDYTDEEMLEMFKNSNLLKQDINKPDFGRN